MHWERFTNENVAQNCQNPLTLSLRLKAFSLEFLYQTLSLWNYIFLLYRYENVVPQNMNMVRMKIMKYRVFFNITITPSYILNMNIFNLFQAKVFSIRYQDIWHNLHLPLLHSHQDRSTLIIYATLAFTQISGAFQKFCIRWRLLSPCILGMILAACHNHKS